MFSFGSAIVVDVEGGREGGRANLLRLVGGDRADPLWSRMI